MIDLKSPVSEKSNSKPGSLYSNASESHSTSLLSPGSRTKEDFMAEKVVAQYNQLHAYLDSLPKSSPRFLNRDLQKPSCSSNLDSRQENARATLSAQHLSAHQMIQKRLLRAAESTLCMLVESYISAEAARSDLKATIRSYEEVLVRFRLRFQPMMRSDCFLMLALTFSILSSV